MSDTNVARRALQFVDSGCRQLWPRIKPFVSATLTIALAAAIAPLLQRLPHANLSLLFMTGVLIVAVRAGLWPSIYASILSFLIFNFFFTPPFLTLAVSEEGDVATLAFFLIMASLTGNLAARLRDALANREAAVLRTESLQSLTRQVAGAASTEQVLQSLVDRLAGSFGQRVVAGVSDAQSGDAVSCSRNGAARDTQTIEDMPTAEVGDGWTFVHLKTARGCVGSVAIHRHPIAEEELDYAVAAIDQAAVAVERTLLVKDLEEAKLVSEREQLRSALLSSVSHDLRTPLASIIGATSTLITYGDSINPADQKILLQSVQEEADRLDRHIQNLLDMTRLDQGELTIKRDWQDISDLVSAASRRLALARHGVRVVSNVAANAQLVHVNGELFEQVFVNLFDNSLCHAPDVTTIRVDAYREGERIAMEISDDGPGIPEAERQKVFDPFYRIHERDRKHGSGLGLSICRGIVNSHDGDISAHAAPDGGALMRIRLVQARNDTDIDRP